VTTTTLAVYRLHAEWRAGTWTVRSRDVDGLLLHARCLGDVQRKACDAIARLYRVERWSFDVVVQHAVVDDTDAQSVIADSVARRTAANQAAREATNATVAALARLEASGMRRDDAQELLGLEDIWDFHRRRDGVCEELFDERVWEMPFLYDVHWPSSAWDRWSHPSTPGECRRLLAALAEEVGGPDELALVDGTPLPDEPFEWDGIPYDIRRFIAEVATHCDDTCDAVFADVEARTACRRLLAVMARQAPEYFRKPLVAERIAAAVCWIIGKANQLFSTKGPPRIGDIGKALGVSSPAGRAPTMLQAAGFAPGHSHVFLESPAFLTSQQRRRIIELRDTYASYVP
jgi:uncharacterized protein DUF6398